MANERVRRPGVSLGRIAGIEVRLDASLLIIFLLIAFSLAMGTFPTWHPDWSAGLRWGVALVAAVAFLASVLVHELSHAIVGRRVGMPVEGITLFLFGGVASMGGEAKSPKAELAMTIVGPLTSLAIGLAGVGVAAALTPETVDVSDPEAVASSLGPVATIFAWLGPINILLAIFNMIPGFPLDGGRVLRAVLWWATGNRLRATRYASKAGQAVGFALIVLGLLQALAGGFVGGLWLVLIGWFLNGAARASYSGLVRSEILEELPVERLARDPALRVPSDMSLEDLARGPALDSEAASFNVYDGDTWAGIVTLDHLREVPRDKRPETRVSDVMISASEVEPIEAGDHAEHALSSMTRQGLDQVPVRKQGRLQGFVRQRDILRWVYLHQEAHA
jgi:Zn-dependent protease